MVAHRRDERGGRRPRERRPPRLPPAGWRPAPLPARRPSARSRTHPVALHLGHRRGLRTSSGPAAVVAAPAPGAARSGRVLIRYPAPGPRRPHLGCERGRAGEPPQWWSRTRPSRPMTARPGEPRVPPASPDGRPPAEPSRRHPPERKVRGDGGATRAALNGEIAAEL